MKILRYASALLVAVSLVPHIYAEEPLSFADLVIYRFDDARKATDLSLAAQKIARNLPYDLLGLIKQNQIDINMGKRISAELKAQVLERLNLFESGVNAVRSYLINPQETVALIYGFTSTYPLVANQPLYQQAFDWLMAPEQAAWLNQVAAIALLVLDRIQFHIDALRAGLEAGTIQFKNALVAAAADLFLAVNRLETILRDSEVQANYRELFNLLKSLHDAAKQINLDNPEFEALRGDVVEKITSLL